MRARWYAPEIGRFISPDTIVPDPTNPQSFNRYSYVNNNALNYTDPTGHCGQYTGDESGLYGQCTQAWGAIEEYYRMLQSERGAEMPQEWILDLFYNADIETLELIMSGVGIDYGYEYKRRPNQYDVTPPCQHWETCYTPVFDGDFGIELGTPLGAREFDSGGNLYNFAPSEFAVCYGPCVGGGVETQIHTQEGDIVRAGANGVVGLGLGFKVSKFAAIAIVGTEVSTVSNLDELNVNYSNIAYFELAGYSVEIRYTPKDSNVEFLEQLLGNIE